MANAATETHTSDLRVRQLVLRDVRDAGREVDFIASTDTVDSYGEIVVQNWDLARFKGNPTILWSHNAWELPIGQATRCEVVKGQLECTIKFASEKANPRAEQVWQGILEGTIRAVSVGFWPRDVRYEKHDGKEICMLDDNELREISVVTIPANPDALAQVKAKALADFRASVTATPEPPVADPPVNLSAAERGQVEIQNMDKDQEIAALKAEVAALKAAPPAVIAAPAPAAAPVDDTRAKALEAQNAVLVAERDAAKKAADDADTKLIAIEVGALVGKKIAASELDAQIRLRKANPQLFADLIAQRSDMLHETQVIPSEKNGAPADPVVKTAADDCDAAAAASFTKSLGSAA